MSLFIELEPFIDYLGSIRKLDDYLAIDLKFPIKWSLPKSYVDETQVVGFDTGDSNFKGISFITQIEKKSVEETLLRIAKVIKLNQERELKEKLFKQTIDKLKQTFEKTDLDKLQNLYFDFATDEEDTSHLDAYDTNRPEDVELGSE